MGAAAIDGPEFMGGGCNTETTHAEIALLSNVRYAAKRVKRLEVFVYRENAHGRPAVSRPCTACMRALIASKMVYSVTYFDRDGNMRTERLM